MATFGEYADHDGLGLAGLVAAGQVTPLELLEACIERIERLNPEINAVVDRLYDRARTQIGAGLARGPFGGVPFLLKDHQSMLAGSPTRSGSRLLGDWMPEANSAIVDRYLAAGLVIAGKASAPELGLMPTTEPERFGPARNPWDRSRTTGGSSGGSAAAVAARMVPLAGGGDGGGSIRIPAACCGLFGMKPSRGRTPTGPYEAESWAGCTVEHVLSRSVRDSAAALDLLASNLPGDRDQLPPPPRPFLSEVGQPPGRLRIAVSRTAYLPATVHPDCLVALDETVCLLGELGHETIDAAPPVNGQEFARDFMLMLAGNTWASVRAAERRSGIRATRRTLEQKTWLAMQLGSVVSAGEYVAGLIRLQRQARAVIEFSLGYDLLLSPTLAAPPLPLGFMKPAGMQAALESIGAALPASRLLLSGPVIDEAAAAAYAFMPWTPVFNMTGQPSMSVPLAWNRQNLPVGMMFSGRPGDEATLFRLAGQLEQARPWKDRVPPGCG